MYKEIARKIRESDQKLKDRFLDIGGVLLAFMEEKKIDGAKLARLSGVSESEVYNVLKNRRTRSGLRTLQKLANPLGKTLADIFNKLAQDEEGNIRKIDKDPSFVMEFKKQGVTIFSDIPPSPDFFIGRISLMGGARGFVSEGLSDNCWVFLRVARGSLEVEYDQSTYPLSTYQKLVFNGKYKHLIKNKSGTEAAEALLVTTPSFWNVASA